MYQHLKYTWVKIGNKFLSALRAVTSSSLNNFVLDYPHPSY